MRFVDRRLSAISRPRLAGHGLRGLLVSSPRAILTEHSVEGGEGHENALADLDRWDLPSTSRFVGLIATNPQLLCQLLDRDCQTIAFRLHQGNLPIPMEPNVVLSSALLME